MSKVYGIYQYETFDDLPSIFSLDKGLFKTKEAALEVVKEMLNKDYSDYAPWEWTKPEDLKNCWPGVVYQVDADGGSTIFEVQEIELHD